MTGPESVDPGSVDPGTIDIVVPYYGDPALLRLTIRSVLDQTAANWRLTIVDDRTSDTELPHHLDQIGDERIHYLRNETNLGVAGNFARCAEVAQADYVNFLGCDDLMKPAYVETISRAIATHPGIAMIQPGVQVIDADGSPVPAGLDRVKRWLRPRVDGSGVVSGERLARSLSHGVWTYFPAITWRRDALGEHPFRQDLQTTLDAALMLELIGRGEEMLILDEVVFNYRRHAASASSKSAVDLSRFAEEADVFGGAAHRFAALGWPSAARAARWHASSRLHALSELPSALRRRDFEVARRLTAHVRGR